MSYAFDFGTAAADHWPVWLLTLVLIVAAVIDAVCLRVPNWLTLSLVAGGWVYSTAMFGWEGLGWSLLGTAVGFGLLFPAHAIGGMGAGDVKLFAGVGAWLHATQTLACLLRFGHRRRPVRRPGCGLVRPVAKALAPVPDDLLRNRYDP